MISTNFFIDIIKHPLSPANFCKVTVIAIATTSFLHATGLMENTVGKALCPHIKRHATNLLQAAKEGSTTARVILVAAAVMVVAQAAMLIAKLTFISCILICSASVIVAGYGALTLGIL